MSQATRVALPAAGAVLGMAVDGTGRFWLATPAGLFAGDGCGWERAPHDLPHLNAVGAAGDCLFVAGPGGLARSTDAGRTWHLAWHEPLETAVTCLAASPKFGQDGLVLAGTGGEGVLRSTDSGRHWELSNFGLAAWSVLALTAAPQWDWREEVFAATDEGVFVSPNAGRAWKRAGAGLDDRAQCLAVSPAYANDRTVFAGTETRGLYRSTDAGRTWRRVRGVAGAVNSLCCAGGTLLAGANDAVLHSEDGGKHWTVLAETGEPVLCLAAAGGLRLAGLGDGSVLVLAAPVHTANRQ